MFHPRGPTFLELARQALSSTETGYDLLAPKFDYTPFCTPAALLAACQCHFGAPRSLSRAVDLCCGTGAVMRVLRPLCRDEVVGVDFSAGMLAQAEQQLRDAPGTARCRFVKADVCDLGGEKPFDLATCFGALGHIPAERQEAFLHAVAQVVRPGGRLVFPSCRRPPWWTTQALFSRAFNAAMHVRNALWSPPFIMFYLRFLWPEVGAALARHGFTVRAHEELRTERGPLPLVLVVATRQADGAPGERPQ